MYKGLLTHSLLCSKFIKLTLLEVLFTCFNSLKTCKLQDYLNASVAQKGQKCERKETTLHNSLTNSML